ncbi:metallophosphoesterase family protein [Prevotella cerevisiae]|uniref:Metallophosphoesterase family protein n=1 Tax=Segatella cerevisiae TaxID=2053716 RepID=A0ABT1BYR5_9BACT|nr:metallophosphoesterase family protein [Segatella cerevisiae]MCO6026234.1 metallophosphoesterase family protein [Segatella cerevisiae]
MSKKTYLICLLSCWVFSTFAQGLRFHQGQFKIVQFTDLHFQQDNPASKQATECIKEIISSEKPDLIVVTGDIVYSTPGKTAMQTVLNIFKEEKKPFCMLFGNHDPEQGTPLDTLYDMMQKAPYSVMPERQGKLFDYSLPVKSEDGTKTEMVIYGMDTHDYSKTKGVGIYQEFYPEQVTWYRNTSAGYTEKNNGKPLPAISFMHYPLPEYNYAMTDPDVIMSGTRMERGCSSALNAGMFDAMKQCGDMMAVFCGHDHDNDCSMMYYGVLLSYGRFSGGNTEYNHLRNGARIIVLKEGEHRFDTWIHERGGQIMNKTSYPESYVKDNWKVRKGTR